MEQLERIEAEAPGFSRNPSSGQSRTRTIAMLARTAFFALSLILLAALPGCGENETQTQCPTGTVLIGGIEVEARLYCPRLEPFGLSLADISYQELIGHDPTTFSDVLFPDPDWELWLPSTTYPGFSVAAGIEDAKRGNPFACVALANHYSFMDNQDGTVAFWLIQADILAGRPGWSLGLFGVLQAGWHSNGPYWAFGKGDVIRSSVYLRENMSLTRAAELGFPWPLWLAGLPHRAARAGLPSAMRQVAWSREGNADWNSSWPLLKEAARRGDIMAWMGIGIRYNIMREQDPEQIVPACAAWATAMAVEEDKFPPGTPWWKERQDDGYGLYDPAWSYSQYCSELGKPQGERVQALQAEWFGAYQRHARETYAAQKEYRAGILPEVVRNIENRP